jgi:hypothetical protein
VRSRPLRGIAAPMAANGFQCRCIVSVIA